MAIEKRANDILDALDLKDPVKAGAVHNAVVNQYRALRARDAVIDGYLRAEGKSENAASSERQALNEQMTKPLHELYVKTLSAYLTPEQVVIVKDKMTHNKVQVTFDAYCEILPNLTDSEKAMIAKELSAAREEAIDGGSADEKHAVFENYKEQINAKLNSNGHDVEKATKEWEAKKSLANKTVVNPTPSAN